MASIIEFPAAAAIWRSRGRAESGAAEGARGIVLLFTGVRYDRSGDCAHRESASEGLEGRRAKPRNRPGKGKVGS